MAAQQRILDFRSAFILQVAGVCMFCMTQSFACAIDLSLVCVLQSSGVTFSGHSFCPVIWLLTLIDFMDIVDCTGLTVDRCHCILCHLYWASLILLWSSSQLLIGALWFECLVPLWFDCLAWIVGISDLDQFDCCVC